MIKVINNHPATTKIPDYCFTGMFKNCSNLIIIEKRFPLSSDKVIIDLRGNIELGKDSVKEMFFGCKCRSEIDNSEFKVNGTPRLGFVYVNG